LCAATEAIVGHKPRPWQIQPVLKVLEGNNIFVLAGMGSGKSLIFAMLAIAAELVGFDGVVLVICPLKALQSDQ
ncbi:hypothetical protein C8R43DRAFT_820274, partial [Mycena crocata]